jgi:hypothetical protein
MHLTHETCHLQWHCSIDKPKMTLGAYCGYMSQFNR